MQKGYYRFPHIYKDSVIFVSEDDLWIVATAGGLAERISAGVGKVSYPRYSPNGQWIAFVGCEDGHSEVYVMAISGGKIQRLTYQASSCQVVGWSPDGQEILYASNADQFTSNYKVLFAISLTGGLPRQVPVGRADAISYGPHGSMVIGRNIAEPAYWQRYRGGAMGHLWCDFNQQGIFQRP